MNPIPFLSVVGVLSFANPLTAQISFSEDFNSMGTSGTAPPAGWTFYGYTDADSTSWFASIPASDIGGGTANATLIPLDDPTTQHSATAGYNLGLSSSSYDRSLGTSPTIKKGVALEWSLINTGSAAVTSVLIGYDIRRFTSVSTENDLPGYQLFYSLDNGNTWTNVVAFNPMLSGAGIQVPNTVGVTTVPQASVTLTSPWGAGASLLLRWVDDNANQTSPDQIIGLDNVTLASLSTLVGESPTLSITSPLITDSFVTPATINITAEAHDSDGTIEKVEFYQGSNKISEALAPPYSCSWSGIATGTYGLTARATDNDGNVTVSDVMSTTVNPTPGSGSLTRTAYLQQQGTTTMTLRWRSSQTIVGRVMFGPAPSSLTSTANEIAARADHEVTLTGLTADTTYYYSIGSADDTLAGGDSDHTFTTSPVPGSTPNTRIWVLGDAGTGTTDQVDVRDAFYTWTGSRDPNLILALGDDAYSTGTDSEFQEKIFNIYGPLMKRVPFWSCLGNHETAQSTGFVDTYTYFSVYTLPKAGECGGVASGTEHYYSFDYGNIHIISLDSMTSSRSPSGPMAMWLANDLAATTSTWILCIFHHPPYTKGSHDSDTETELIEMRANFLPILETGGVDLVLSGHSHSYERSYLLDGHYGLSDTLTTAMKKNGGDGRPTGDGAYIKPLTGPRDHFGTVYVVSGSSGRIGGGSLDHPAHFIGLNNLGSLVLDVNGNRLDATFIREDGSLPDTFTIIKQGAADTDGDEIPDAYEIANGLNRFDAADALLDTDHDGISNLDEYMFGLLPGTPDRYQWAATFDKTTGHVDVAFTTVTDRNYQVYWSSDLLTWHPGSDVVAGDGETKGWTDDGSVTGTAPGSAARRFYRVQVAGAP